MPVDERGRALEAPGVGDGATLPNLLVRIGLVLFSPAELFDRLRARPAWVGALLLLVALNLVGNLIVPEELLREMAARQLPADADPAALGDGVRFLRIGSIVGGLIFTPLWAVLVAGYVLLVYTVFLGGEATFRQVLSASVHALVILAIGGMLTLLLMIARGELGAALALHLLVPGLETGGWPYRFLHGLNVFGLWTAVVLGIGVGRVYVRNAGPAIALLLATYVALKAIAGFIPPLAGS